MKLIDLLNMIARGEKTPDKIIYKGYLYTHNGVDSNANYYCSELGEIIERRINLSNLATDKIEEVEDEKLTKLHHCCMTTNNEEIKVLIQNYNDLVDHYNQIIDYLRESESE